MSTSNLGGSLYAFKSSIFMDTVDVLNSTGFKGFYMHLHSCKTVILNSHFISGVGSTGLVAEFEHSELRIANSFFDGARAIDVATLYCDEEAVCTIESSLFSNNSATFGPVLYFNGVRRSSVINSSFIGNIVQESGCVSLRRSYNCLFSACSFRNNFANMAGAALHIYHSGDVRIEDSIFLNNTAGTAGAIKVESLSDVYISGSSFSGNHARDTAGVISLNENSFVDVDKCQFSDHNSPIGGVAVVQHDSILQVRNSIFTNNSAYYHGIFLYICTRHKMICFFYGE